MFRQGFRLIVVLSALIALVAVPQAAEAKKKRKKNPAVVAVSATQSTSTNNQLVSVAANCPSGKLAVGGGFSAGTASTAGTLTDIIIVYESRRDSGGNGWTVSGARQDSGGAGPAVPLTATAYCRTPKSGAAKKASAAKKKRRIKISEVSAVGSATTLAGVSSSTASCPGKQKVISGGFTSSPPPHVSSPQSFPLFFASVPAGNGWTASMVVAGEVPVSETTFAYCASGLSAVFTNGFATLPASGPTTAVASAQSSPCPTKRRLAGGGFQGPQPADPGAIPLPVESVATGTQWKYTALNLSSTPASLGALASCI